MKRCKFSNMQRFPAIIGLATMISILLIFVPVVAYAISRAQPGIGWLIAVGLFAEALGVVLVSKTGFALSEVQIDEAGVRIVTRNGSVKRSLPWEQIRKYSVCSFVQGSDNYLCFSANEQLPAYRMCYPGVEWAMFYDKRTIAIPFTPELYSCCEKQFEAHGIEIKPEVVGHVSPDTPGVQEFNRRNIRKWWLILAIVIVAFVVLMAVVFAITR